MVSGTTVTGLGCCESSTGECAQRFLCILDTQRLSVQSNWAFFNCYFLVYLCICFSFCGDSHPWRLVICLFASHYLRRRASKVSMLAFKVFGTKAVIAIQISERAHK